LNNRRRSARAPGERASAEQMLRILRHGGDVRRQKIHRVRTKVRSQGYENELKLTVAIERLVRFLRT
jgi:hypothetical protein